MSLSKEIGNIVLEQSVFENTYSVLFFIEYVFDIKEEYFDR